MHKAREFCGGSSGATGGGFLSHVSSIDGCGCPQVLSHGYLLALGRFRSGTEEEEEEEEE